jgi:HEPN domain-containing protein
MAIAANDLFMAKDGVKRGYRLEALCFHAQQAGEKALKALLVERKIPFPKAHDLEKLLALLPPDLSPPSGVRAASALSEYSQTGRYPHGFQDVTPGEHRQAVKYAQAVHDWVEKMLAGRHDPGVHEAPARYGTGSKKNRRIKKSRRKRG